MPIKFRCPHCRQKLEISSKKAGVKLACPACEKSIRVPSIEEIEAALKEKQSPGANDQQLVKKELPVQELPQATNLESNPSSTTGASQNRKPLVAPPKLIKPKSPSIEDEFSYSESQPLSLSQINKQLQAPQEAYSSKDPSHPNKEEGRLDQSKQQVKKSEATSTLNKSKINAELTETKRSNLELEHQVSEKNDHAEDGLWNDLIEDHPSTKSAVPQEDHNLRDYGFSENSNRPLDELFEDEEDELEQVDFSVQADRQPSTPNESLTDPVEETPVDEEVNTEESNIQESTPAKSLKKSIIPVTPRNWPIDDDEENDYQKKSIPPQEDMDLTPMVDVTFLLLIFFMLTASFSIQKSIPVPKPDPKGKGAVQSVTIEDLEKDSILVEITADNKIFIDEVELGSPDGLSTEIIKASNNGEKIEVVIQPDPQALHEFTVKVIDAANEAGMQKIRLADVNES